MASILYAARPTKTTDLNGQAGWPRATLRPLCIALGLAGAACTGAIQFNSTGIDEGPHSGGAGGGAANRGSAGGTGAGDAGGTDGSNSSSCATSGPDPGVASIRRLTRSEYNNTVRDLLGDTTRPAARFPAESLALGFDNNAEQLSTSTTLSEAYLLAADDLASAAVAVTDASIFPCDIAVGSDPCATRFIAEFGRRAYRRPLDAADAEILQDVFATGKRLGGFKNGIRLVIAAALQSPRFLYRVETSGVTSGTASDPVRVTGYELASRLSYTFWKTMPDDILLDAAETGELDSAEGIRSQVQRVLQDPRAKAMVENFHDQWLGTTSIDALEKDYRTFPSFTPGVRELLQSELHAFVTHAFWEGQGDLAGLLTAPYTFLNRDLGGYYGMGDTAPSGSRFVQVHTDPTRHAGVLTKGAFLATHAKANQTSPILRGKFIREAVLCESLPPPPPNVDATPPDPDPSLTTRQRFAEHSENPACAACHKLMDPIGLGFESFDGIGRFRNNEAGVDVDATGHIVGSDVEGPFDGVAELGHKLADSDQVRDCMARQWFRYAYGRGEGPRDECSLDLLKRRFAEQGFQLVDLISALAETDAFLYREATAQTP